MVALLHITLLGKHPLPTSPACNTLACQLCILHSLPPLALQVAWILAIGVACRFVLQHQRCLGASIAAMLASLLATPIACEPDQCVCFVPCHLCKQPALWGLALRVDSHCSAGVVWVDQHCCHDGSMACQHSLCWCALLLPRIAWLPTSGACCSLGIAVQTALANLL